MWTLPDSQLKVALTLLLEANWKPSVIRWGKTERILQRGQTLLSERGISERYGVDRQTIRDCLDALRRQETISTERTHRGTIVTWLNYLKYQDVEFDEEPTDPTTQPTTHPTDHNKVTSKQPTKASADAAAAIRLVTQYVGQVSKRVLEVKDVMAIRRRLKAGMTGEDIAARCYVLIQRKEASTIAHALTAGFDIRVEKYASHLQLALVDIRGRFGNGNGSAPVARATDTSPPDPHRVPEIGLDLVACERAVQSLGGEAGILQNRNLVDDWMQSRLARQADPVGQPGAFDGADARSLHRPEGEDPPEDARPARSSPRRGAVGAAHGGNGRVQASPDDIPFP
jgi:hypothetical protein